MIKKISKYQKLEQIGEGVYGVVYKAKNIQDNTLVAIKKIRIDPEKEGTPSTVIREIALLKEINSIKNNNIVRLLEVINTSKKVTLVFEYCETDLKKLLENYNSKKEKIPKKLIQNYFKCLLNGIKTLHSKKIIHRDIKPSNLLINGENILKICDFGLARGIGVPIQNYTSEVVSVHYRPPEVLLGFKIYENSVDLWAAGCIFAEMLLGYPIFMGKNEAEQCEKIFKIIGTPDEENFIWLKDSPEWNAGLAGEGFEKFAKIDFRDAFPEIADEDAYDLLDKLLIFDYNKRLSAESALKHKYFN